MASSKETKIYTVKEFKELYAIMYELYKTYKFPNSIEVCMQNWKEQIKKGNDLASIGYAVCKDLYKEDKNKMKKYVKINLENMLKTKNEM